MSNSSIFPSVYEEFIYKRTYSRWLEKEKRRESWDETVDRYDAFFESRVPADLMGDYKKAIKAIRKFKVMPSMRSLWSAGQALERDNIAGYNCAYTTIDHPNAFAEILYILMNGAGVGFSVERQYVSQLPVVPELEKTDEVIKVADSKLGWATAYKRFINRLYEGYVCTVDVSGVRPEGARLKTFGGRASGPAPFMELIEFTQATFVKAQGRKLNSLEAHDLACKVASVVVVGGVRRSSCISLSNLSDTRMRHAKDGEFYITNKQRSLANNSVAYTEKPEMTTFTEEWLALMRSGNGERGIVNREGLTKSAAALGRKIFDFGLNPCAEITLRPSEFCNLSEVVVRHDDTLGTLKEKIKSAVILGTLQSTLTDFGFIRDKWKKNCEEERLLGVSMTGVMDHPLLQTASEEAQALLKELRAYAHEVSEIWSKALGVNKPLAITTNKPSGTVSQLVNCASGLHPRYSDYYIRRVRVSAKDPVAHLLISRGVNFAPEVGEDPAHVRTLVFDFPVAGPGISVTRNDRTALQQLEVWKMFKTCWTDHNPSVTIYVKDEEWLEVGAWVYNNWDIVGGISFLPHDGGTYPLAPYEEITKEQYEELASKFPSIDFSDLSEFEQMDETIGSSELACSGGSCELR